MQYSIIYLSTGWSGYDSNRNVKANFFKDKESSMLSRRLHFHKSFLVKKIFDQIIDLCL